MSTLPAATCFSHRADECPKCSAKQITQLTRPSVGVGGSYTLYQCRACGVVFEHQKVIPMTVWA